MQPLFADRFRSTPACCPLTNGAQGSPEPLRLQATPEFRAIAATAVPLALKEQIVRVERALPRLEHIGSSATQRLSNGIATMTQAADNLCDRQPAGGELGDCRICIPPPQIALISQLFCRGE